MPLPPEDAVETGEADTRAVSTRPTVGAETRKLVGMSVHVPRATATQLANEFVPGSSLLGLWRPMALWPTGPPLTCATAGRDDVV